MNIRKSLSILFICIPALAQADNLDFTLTNLSKSTICFESSDIFDFSKCAYYNQTISHTYKSTPKNIRFIFGNGAYNSFYLQTSPSCDALGFDSLNKMTHFNGPYTSQYKRYLPGKVQVTISDMPGSTVSEKYITCKLEIKE